MSKFKETLTSLGFFWPHDKPNNKWPGMVSIDGFPRAQLYFMGARPGDGRPLRGRLNVHGITEGNEHITMLEATGVPRSHNIGSQSSTESTVITANCMLVSSKHFDAGQHVRRLSFSSAAAEHVLRLQASEDYKELAHRRLSNLGHEWPILHKQVASYVDLARKIRVRVFRSRVPTTTIEPTSLWTLDFLEANTPKQALSVLHQFRSLLSLICGEVIDLWDVRLLHKTPTGYLHSDVYFNDPVGRPLKNKFFPLPILAICHNRELFRRIAAGWLADPPSRRIGRGAFAEIVKDGGTLRLSHLRELVTIIETQTSSEGTAPLSKKQSCALRQALRAALEGFAANEPDSDSWLVSMKRRIDNVNYHDAKIQLKNFISRLPKGFVSVPQTFHNDVIELRNTLVHDMSRIKSGDYNKLSFFVAKLKGLYALSDALALGAKVDEVMKGSVFLMRAEHAPLSAFTDDATNASGSSPS